MATRQVIMQIATTIELANRFPDVIEAIVVGNEVLLRGEMSAPELARTIRRKLILEISGLAPPPALVPAQFEPADCLIGEKLYRQRNWDQTR